MSLQLDAAELAHDLAQLRHALHREPEIGLNLPRTQEKVLAALADLPVEITTGKALTSVTAVLRGATAGPTVLLRGDMDALPLREKSGAPFSSTVEGVMHACGHDLHTTMLVGAAKLLAARRGGLPGNVIFMFQPGEEGDGGAQVMIDEGLLDAAGDRPVAAYGLHVVSSALPIGLFATKIGPLMAAADTLRVTVRGAGGHGSQPHRAKDPIPAACEMVTALHTVTRSFDVFDPVVVTVGTLHAGTVENVIPDEATFGATIRSFSGAAHDQLRDRILMLINGIAAAHGLEVDAQYEANYPVMVTNAAETQFMADAITELFGPERFIWAPQPVTGSEDFSFVLNNVPGSFAFLGACPPDRDLASAPYNHAPGAMFDDSVIPDGAALLAQLALRRLAPPTSEDSAGLMTGP